MEKLLSENKLLDTRRGFLKSVGVGALTAAGLANSSLAQGVDFSNSQNLSDEKLFTEVRNQLMLKENLVYLNTGTLGPAPRHIVNKITSLIARLESNPANENFGPMGAEMNNVRGKVASFMGADEDEIVMTRNTTEGISTVCSSIDWQAGDEILTTNHEHGGAETGLEYLANTKGAVIRKITMPYPVQSKDQLLELVSDNITDKTKLLLLSHVETVTGLRWPIKDVARLIKDRDILFIVDGAQAPGMLDINLHEMDCDVYACSGHKWIMGPKETGILYLRKNIQSRLQSVFLSGGYNVYSASSGTRNAPNFIALGDVLDWHMAIGTKRIEKRCMELAQYCQKKLTGIEGITIISSSNPSLSSAIVSFSLDERVRNGDVFAKMRDNDITIKRLPQYNAIRISNHMFTTNADVDQMIEKLKEFL